MYAVVEVDLPINCCAPLLLSATANLHQFTSYHQSWLVDNVQKEEEESCKQWLLQSSPDVGSVREGEEQGQVRCSRDSSSVTGSLAFMPT